MIIELCKTVDNPNVVNKDFQVIKQVDIIFRHATNNKSPLLILHRSNLDGVNYVHIPTFKRFYFIGGMQQLNNTLTEVQLKTDLLMTYKQEIMNTEMVITATNKPSDLVATLPVNAKPVIKKYMSDVTLPKAFSCILTTIGNVKGE